MPIFTPEDYREAIRKLGFKCRYDYSRAESALFQCCFHKDNKPSMGFKFTTGQYNCFSCHRSGTIRNLCYELTGRRLEQFLGIIEDVDMLNPPKTYEESNEAYVRKTVHSVDIRGNMVPCHMSNRALEYLDRRGITLDTAVKMDMKYAKEIYINGSYFTDRLLIPVYDGQQRIINVEARAIEKDAEKKCLYPFKTVKPIYDWYKLNRNEPLYLFEGLVKMAVARSDSFFTNSTSTLGSQISEYQLRQLNLFPNVILVRDMDLAGEKMATKVREGYKGNFGVWLLGDSRIKDVDEIPTDLHQTVKEYRENGGFIQDINFL